MKIYTVGKRHDKRVAFPGATFDLKRSGRAGWFAQTSYETTIGISNLLLVGPDAATLQNPRYPEDVLIVLTRACIEQDTWRNLSLGADAGEVSDNVLLWFPEGPEFSELQSATQISGGLICMKSTGSVVVSLIKKVGAQRLIEEQFVVSFGGEHVYVDGVQQEVEIVRS
ncbi:MAG TPA: hypothetical protein V6C81_11655 [Planktothrix sp.]